MTSLEEVAVELYRLPLADFTSRRNALVKELKAQDRGLAEVVSQLPKPAVPAWAVNVFAHQLPDELAELLDLAAELREAQSQLSKERMRDLAAQTQTLVQQVVGDVARAAEEAGNALSDTARSQVEQTLRAAMADADAGNAVRAGLLAKPLETGGFGSVDLSGAVVGTPAHVPAKPRRTRTKESNDDREQEAARAAAQALEDAEGSQRVAEAALAESEEHLAAAQAEQEAAESQLARLREELRAAEQRQGGGARELRKAKQEQEKAAKHVDAARRRTEAARQAVDG